MKREWMQKLSEYLPSMNLDDYSFKLHQERVDKCHTQCSYHHVLTLLKSNSLLSMLIASLASVIKLSLTYPHVPDEARMNNHQASYLVSIPLIFVCTCSVDAWINKATWWNSSAELWPFYSGFLLLAVTLEKVVQKWSKEHCKSHKKIFMI